MESLIIQSTDSSPYINFDTSSNNFVIKGESFPENAAKFYSPVMEYIRNYLRVLCDEQVTFQFEIIYFNSSTSKAFLNLFELLDSAVKEGKRIIVNWRCHEQNESAIECGEEFMEDLESLPFNIVLF
ncbi:hypothetical protein N752_31280 [Desulforamulus aquiferis]|nr:DUF1987 domain-containing protein [Desulforamulus aquiferis]RYD01236.1 hypothetical protein N752_31280 [Desulforamulus aquiferis]